MEAARPNQRTILVPERVIDGRDGALLEHEVWINGQTIEAVVPIGSRGRPAAAPVRAFPGATLLPGLIDVHQHLTFDGSAEPAVHMMAERVPALALLGIHNAHVALRAGVTTVRDCGAPHEVVTALRDAVLAGLIVGPRVLACGVPLTSPGGHCYFMGGEVRGDPGVAVAALVNGGADFIKVMLTGGGLTPGSDPTALQFSRQQLEVMVEAAHARGRRVAAHVHTREAALLCANAGVETVEHASFLTEAGPTIDPAAAEALARAGCAVVPTLVPALRAMEAGRTLRVAAKLGLTNEAFQERRFDLIPRLRAAGVTVLAGTDAGATLTPHDSLPDELVLLARAGIPNAEVLQIATSTAARALGIDDRVGTIAHDRTADMLVVRGNPLDDLRSLREVLAVVRAGILLAPEQLIVAG